MFSREEKINRILSLLGALTTIVFCTGPFIYMIVISFSARADFSSANVAFELTFDNYQRLLCDSSLHFPRYVINSLIVSLLSAFLAVVSASLAAYGLTRFSFTGKTAVLFFVLAVSLFPQISMVGYLFRFMTHLGWINSYQALIGPYSAWILPLSVWILVSYFSQIPYELDKAALIDGCSRWRILCKIIVPIGAPGIFSVFLLSFIFAFNEFLFALMFTTDFHARTVPVAIALFEGMHGQIPWGTIMAASVIAILPVIVVVVFFQRRIISGLTKGALKG